MTLDLDSIVRYAEGLDERRRDHMTTFDHKDEAEVLEIISDCVAEVRRLQAWVDDLQSGMWINCVYCGHRYGPNDERGGQTMREALERHIETCHEHPMSKLRAKMEALTPKKLDGPPTQPGVYAIRTPECEFSAFKLPPGIPIPTFVHGCTFWTIPEPEADDATTDVEKGDGA